MKNLAFRVAMTHLKSPEYRGDLLEYIKNRQESEDTDKNKEAVMAASSWLTTLDIVKETIDQLIKHTNFNVERRGGNFYFHNKDEDFKDSKSYNMIFVSPDGQVYVSNASNKEREFEEKNSKRRNPQHEPPLGSKKYNMMGGLKAIFEILHEDKTKIRYQ